MGSESKTGAEIAAAMAVRSLGMGFDVSKDVSFAHCKKGGQIIVFCDDEERRAASFPGGISLPDVRNSVTIHEPEERRLTTDVLSYHQMSERFNRGLALSGEIPSGLFNSMYNFYGCLERDASITKSLAFDGRFITLYNVETDVSNIQILDHIKREVPTTWDPSALASFIMKYGTHVIVGVRMGGKDVIYLKQERDSYLKPAQIKMLLEESAHMRFGDADAASLANHEEPTVTKVKEVQSVTGKRRVTFSYSLKTVCHKRNEQVVSIIIRKGGIDTGQEYAEWLATVPMAPDAISMSFLPITSLLEGVPGTEFLCHAVDLYLQYKHAIEELRNFLEYQHPRQWTSAYDFSEQPCTSNVRFTIMGPKLHLNTAKVVSGKKPVTGIRFYLEGKELSRLAISLQHLSSPPGFFKISDDPIHETEICKDICYIEPVRWKFYTHVCTATVECKEEDGVCIVTQASLQVHEVHKKKVLFIVLGFSKVKNAKVSRSEWVGASNPMKKPGSSSSFSLRLGITQAPVAAVERVDMNSSFFADSPPPLGNAPRMAKFVDMADISRGPEVVPGYWIVTGAKLCVEDGKISLRVKYSLLKIVDDKKMLPAPKGKFVHF